MDWHPRLLMWFMLWAILLAAAIVLGTLSSGTDRIVGFAVVPAAVVLVLLGRALGNRKAVAVVLLAGVGFYLQVFALSSLFSQLRVESTAARREEKVLVLQGLELIAEMKHPDIGDLTTQAGRDDLQQRLRVLVLASLANTGEVVGIHQALTPNYLNISLFAFGSLVAFGAAVVDALPRNALPASLLPDEEPGLARPAPSTSSIE